MFLGDAINITPIHRIPRKVYPAELLERSLSGVEISTAVHRYHGRIVVAEGDTIAEGLKVPVGGSLVFNGKSDKVRLGFGDIES
jgi:hypothetical protein